MTAGFSSQNWNGPRLRNGDAGGDRGARASQSDATREDLRLLPASRPAFTLTELLIVIAIIAVLASLITAAAVNAMNASKRAQILLEIKQMSGSLEDMKNDYGAYPPNVVNNGDPLYTQVGQDLQRMFKKAFPRMNQQEEIVLKALVGDNQPSNGAGNQVTSPQLEGGMTAAEAVYFWLGGFSDDPQYPISGTGGPSFVDTGSAADEVLETRKRRFEFDLNRLAPRNDAGGFEATDSGGTGRFIEYTVTINGTQQNRRINLWQYAPRNSEQPFVYFDVSRYKPGQYDPPADFSDSGSELSSALANVVALKQYRRGVTSNNASGVRDLAFVNAGKFQMFHAGLDNAWGGFGGPASGGSGNNPPIPSTVMIYPEGPFVGDISDTLTNLTDGELADSQEN